MEDSEQFVLVGKISGVFGVQGWVKVFSFTDPRHNILSYSPLFISNKGKWVELKILKGRRQGKGLVMSLEGITDPDQALLLTGSELAIKKSQLVATVGDDFYWSDLIGSTVINMAEEKLGIVDSLLETGKHDVLVVKEGKQERLIPFVLDEFIKTVDLNHKIIRVDWELDY